MNVLQTENPRPLTFQGEVFFRKDSLSPFEEQSFKSQFNVDIFKIKKKKQVQTWKNILAA